MHSTDRMEFIVQIINEYLGLFQDNMLKIRQDPRPSTKKDVQAFRGLMRYYF